MSVRSAPERRASDRASTAGIWGRWWPKYRYGNGASRPGLLFLAIGLASLYRAVYAGTIYEQLPPADFNGALFISSTVNGLGETPGFRVADDFEIALDSRVDQVQWWGEPRPRTNDFTFAFYADVGGLPGTLLLSTGGDGLTSTEVSPAFTHLMYTITLERSFAVASGSRYWFSIFDRGSESQWGWLTASDDYGIAHAFTLVPPGDSWSLDNQSMAYRLIGAIPEPSVLVLFSIACSLGALFRRIRRLIAAIAPGD